MILNLTPPHPSTHGVPRVMMELEEDRSRPSSRGHSERQDRAMAIHLTPYQSWENPTAT